MEPKKYCPICGHEFKQGESDYNYDTADTVYTCPECEWEGTTPLSPDNEEDEDEFDDETRSVAIVEVSRTDYSPGQVLANRNTMTIGELKQMLEEYDDDDPTPIMFSHDNGYTYGPLQRGCIDIKEMDSDGCLV